MYEVDWNLDARRSLREEDVAVDVPGSGSVKQ
jgi:hypothetical protein